MKQYAVIVKDLHKTFRLPHEKHSGLKSMLVNFYKRRKGFEMQHVLKGVSFKVEKGEFFGIVGRNGSGKSTLLKLLAGIYVPGSGDVLVNGNLTPFIELGVGFNPELTGRENVFLNGALLGFNRREMAAMYDSIVEFAELGRFMDQKLKNYSSGMQVRLAFSIAIRARSDILLIDEVLAVGDTAFQKKCFEHFINLKQSGTTVILVTHDMSAVERFCDRALVIDRGKSYGVMSPAEAAGVYNRLNATGEATQQEDSPRWGSGRVTLKSVKVKGGATNGQKFTLEIETHSEKSEDIVVGLAFIDQFGVNIAGPNSKGKSFKSNKKIRYEIERLPFTLGEYDVTVALFDRNVLEEFDHIEKALKLSVAASNTIYGKVDLFGTWSQE